MFLQYEDCCFCFSLKVVNENYSEGCINGSREII